MISVQSKIEIQGDLNLASISRKLSKTNLALIFFTVTLLLSIIGVFAMVSVFHPDYFIRATKLDQKPDHYFSLENPDSFILQAINDPGHSVEVRTIEGTQIDELLATHNTSNFEYNSTYYDIGLVVGDRFPPAFLPLFLLAGIVISASALVVLASLKTISYVRKEK